MPVNSRNTQRFYQVVLATIIIVIVVVVVVVILVVFVITVIHVIEVKYENTKRKISVNVI